MLPIRLLQPLHAAYHIHFILSESQDKLKILIAGLSPDLSLINK